MQNLEPTFKANILTGFKACGISPFNPEAVLKKIKPRTVDNENATNGALLEAFQNVMQDASKVEDKSAPKRMKLDGPVGKSVGSAEATTPVNLNQLIGAVRSQLYFSQISAWLSSQEESNVKLLPANFRYRLAIPGETYECSKFMSTVSKHNFPATDLGNGLTVNVTLLSLPRMSSVPKLKCPKCDLPELEKQLKMEQQQAPGQLDNSTALFDDRMHTYCTLKGKHRCEDLDDFDSAMKKDCKFAKLKRICNNKNSNNIISEPSTSRQIPKLQVDIAKANLYRQKYMKNQEVVKLEKRNSSPNMEQVVKTPKLDLNEINDALKVLNSGGVSAVEAHHQYNKNDLSRQLRPQPQEKQQNNDPVTLIFRNCRLLQNEDLQNDNNNKTVVSNSNNNNINSTTDGANKKCVHKLESTVTKLGGGTGLGRGCLNNQNWSHIPPLLLSPSSSSPASSLSLASTRGDMLDCCASDSSKCDNPCERSDITFSNSDSNSNKEKINIYLDNNCDNSVHHHNVQTKPRFRMMRDISNVSIANNALINNNIPLAGSYFGKARQRITFEDFPDTNRKRCTGINVNNTNSNNFVDGDSIFVDCDKIIKEEKLEGGTVGSEKSNNSGLPNIDIPSPMEQAKFRKSLDSAASMVFHSRTGLPLTSSPAPVRKGKRFDFDSSINSVSAIKSALFSASFTGDDDSESDGSIVSPCSPDSYGVPKREPPPIKYYRKGHSANLLGSFEESVLNGRLEPVSTVHGFTAELGASGSFVPRHLVVPVTVFFYTLGDNDKVSSPYLGHINLGKKGYNVPKTGTVQVTLSNPLGTVVKMFVIMYDLSDMPPNSQTFIRQRTLYMPTNCKDENLEWGPKWLRYLIHLRYEIRLN
ncbi:hypothetical protein MML48_2g00005513 [Holotrichia oblita]|uniref:Uncharacterized protein n=1 Tax=Holotrichia oblita TaxID=644536 RepID=A0ACB9TJM8_HOLOL|nr:hypothetical protein MML48_2g00005513 [Holotrichia oblita]